MGAAIAMADAVVGTSTTTGVGTLQLGPAPAGYREWAAAGIASGARVPYEIREGTTFEIGLGTLTSGTPWTLSRDTVRASSAGGALVNWGGGGTRFVALVVPAADAVLRDDDGMITVPPNPAEPGHAAPRSFAEAQPVAKTRVYRAEHVTSFGLPFAPTWANFIPITLPTGTRRIFLSGCVEAQNTSTDNRLLMNAAVRDAADTTSLALFSVGWFQLPSSRSASTGIGGAVELSPTPAGAFVRLELTRQSSAGPVNLLTATWGVHAVTD